MDLVHYVLIREIQDDGERKRLNDLLTGAPEAPTKTVVDEQTGIQPPSWWRGDAYASRSAYAAASTLRHRR